MRSRALNFLPSLLAFTLLVPGVALADGGAPNVSLVGASLSTGQAIIWDRTAHVAQVQREVGPEFGCATWDWQAATGGPGSMIAWALREPAYASRDLIHFSRAGYEWSAERFLEALWGVTATAP